eukprot:5783517-Pyramimonas_sp.AAC.1
MSQVGGAAKSRRDIVNGKERGRSQWPLNSAGDPDRPREELPRHMGMYQVAGGAALRPPPAAVQYAMKE